MLCMRPLLSQAFQCLFRVWSDSILQVWITARHWNSKIEGELTGTYPYSRENNEERKQSFNVNFIWSSLHLGYLTKKINKICIHKVFPGLQWVFGGGGTTLISKAGPCTLNVMSLHYLIWWRTFPGTSNHLTKKSIVRISVYKPLIKKLD